MRKRELRGLPGGKSATNRYIEFIENGAISILIKAYTYKLNSDGLSSKRHGVITIAVDRDELRRAVRAIPERR